MFTRKIECPLGILELEANDEALTAIRFTNSDKLEDAGQTGASHSLLAKAEEQLGEYFDGERKDFDLPLAPEGTDFQKQVWDALLELPYGQTTTYLKLSEKIGNVKAIRAVGKANGQNPIPIVIPCHRVIGSDDSLIGYGGGIERKRWLLQHEGALLL